MKLATTTAAISIYALAAALSVPAFAADGETVAVTTNHTTTNNNYVDAVSTSKGSGDATSKGEAAAKGEATSKGEGTANLTGTNDSASNSDSDSNSNATAVSNGYTDSSVDNSVNNGAQTMVIADQELSVSSTHNQLTITGGSGGTPSLQTGAISLDGAALSDFAGVLNNAMNTGPQSNAQSTTNISVNSSLTGSL